MTMIGTKMTIQKSEFVIKSLSSPETQYQNNIDDEKLFNIKNKNYRKNDNMVIKESYELKEAKSKNTKI